MWRADSLPGHAAVDGKVEGVGEADDAVDEERDVPDKFVIKKILINTKTQTFMYSMYRYCGPTIS